MTERPAICVTLSGLGRLFGADLRAVVETARIAEACGVDQVALPDHLAIGPHTERYPYGPFPLPPEEPWLEPLTALAVIAGATTSLRLATAVLIAPLRPALLLAKTLATLDVLSGGRIEVGIGVGWQREEFDAAGVPFATRGARLDDALRACRVLWTQAPASLDAPSVRFESIQCWPRPATPGGPPLWFGGDLHAANLARIAEFGSGWLPMDSSADALRAGMERIRAALTQAGRGAAAFGLRALVPALRGAQGVDLERSLAACDERIDAGATQLAFHLGAFVRDRAALRSFFERLGRLRR